MRVVRQVTTWESRQGGAQTGSAEAAHWFPSENQTLTRCSSLTEESPREPRTPSSCSGAFRGFILIRPPEFRNKRPPAKTRRTGFQSALPLIQASRHYQTSSAGPHGVCPLPRVPAVLGPSVLGSPPERPRHHSTAELQTVLMRADKSLSPSSQPGRRRSVSPSLRILSVHEGALSEVDPSPPSCARAPEPRESRWRGSVGAREPAVPNPGTRARL